MIREFLHFFGIHWWKYVTYFEKINKFDQYSNVKHRNCRLCTKKQKLVMGASYTYEYGVAIPEDEWRDV